MAEIGPAKFGHPISAVTFDLYNTLLVSEPVIDHTALSARVFSRSLQADGLEMDIESAARMFTTAFDRSSKDGLTYFEHRISTFLASRRINAPTIAVQKYAADILDSWEARWKLVDDAIRVISTLKKNNIAVALISNFDHFPHVQRVVDRVRLSSLMDAIVVSSEIGFDKPDKRIFQHALTLLGVEPANALHIGDDIVDIKGALGAGMSAVRIDHSGVFDSIGVGDDVPAIRSLSELHAIVGI
jgi:putative hydrolase of the HAD superfamily